MQFYETHPINEQQILHKLEEAGLALATLFEDALKEHDQDHFGGLEAVDVLADRAGIDAHSHVLDVCSGVGGPARYLAHRLGCRVTGLDITKSRHEAAVRLTRLVRLDHLVDFRLGNALEMPFADGTFDVVIGQEAFAHVPDKPRLIRECTRVVRPGGTIAFTDIVRRPTLGAEAAARLQREMTFLSWKRATARRGCSRMPAVPSWRRRTWACRGPRSCAGASRCTAAWRRPPWRNSARRTSENGTTLMPSSSGCSASPS